MLLEIRFTDPKFARYLESTVSGRDLVAFTFESSRDMNLFLQKVRVELGLKRVNAICSQGGPVDRPQNNIQQLSYLGFYTYLVDTITAPDAIVRYLCKQYAVHRIPIGNDHTYRNSENVPANINFFFTENHRFSVRVSAYSGEKSVSTTEVREAKLMANTVDVEEIGNFNKQLSLFEQQSQGHKAKMQEIDKKLLTLEGNLNELNTRRKAINEGVEKVRTILAQIRVQTKKVQDIESEPTFDIQQERDRTRKKQKECVLKQCKIHADLKNSMATLYTETMNGEVWKAKLEFYRNGIVQQETELRELRNELRSVQATLENIENQLIRSKSNAKEKLVEAKRSCNNKLPDDEGFPYKEDFEVLPADITRLQEHCYELQTRVDCMDQGDEQVIKEYEEREKLISKLKSEVSNSSDMNKILAKKMETIQSKWLPPLENLLRDIDKSFGDMFSKLGCAGEIKLEKGGSDEDYDKYGIAILVRFRASEQLQQLTRHAQSGGERALSTALYLMALQRLTTVPFRCVDEINQGMDPINERKMFELLVKVTTECDNAQYFLLTPKLLTNLEYNSKIMIHTIMNGQKIMRYNKWNYDAFLQKAHHYRMA
uniref:Structural maintenance of chromosomes protein 5 n=1 Tax=Heliothis virescens TaxID=7102 RepID=A0A2A4IY75_HELVI